MKASGTNPGSSDTTGLNHESYMLISISLIHLASWTARTKTYSNVEKCINYSFIKVSVCVSGGTYEMPSPPWNKEETPSYPTDSKHCPHQWAMLNHQEFLGQFHNPLQIHYLLVLADSIHSRCMLSGSDNWNRQNPMVLDRSYARFADIIIGTFWYIEWPLKSMYYCS